MHYSEAPDTSLALPEHFPTIIVDTAIRAGIDDIDVDLHMLANTLAERGLTPEQIDETTVTLSAGEDAAHGIEIGGRYVAETKEVLLFPVSDIKRRIDLYDKAHGIYRENAYTAGGRYLGWQLDRILHHELEHRIVDAEGGMAEEERHQRTTKLKLNMATIGSVALGLIGIAMEGTYGSHNLAELVAIDASLMAAAGATAILLPPKIMNKAYKRSPEENRARDAEEDDREFFIVQLSYQNEPYREASDAVH